MVAWICTVVSDPDDQEFLIELYEEFHDLMFSVARRYNNNWMSCEDIVQESILRIMDKLDVLRKKKRCVQAGYIAMVVRNIAINTLKHEDVVKAHTAEIAEQEPTALTMDELLIARENVDDLMRALQQLPEAEQLLLEGKYMLGYSDTYLAEQIGCQPKSIRMKLTRARRHTLQLMQQTRKGEK